MGKEELEGESESNLDVLFSAVWFLRLDWRIFREIIGEMRFVRDLLDFAALL